MNTPGVARESQYDYLEIVVTDQFMRKPDDANVQNEEEVIDENIECNQTILAIPLSTACLATHRRQQRSMRWQGPILASDHKVENSNGAGFAGELAHPFIAPVALLTFNGKVHLRLHRPCSPSNISLITGRNDRR